VETAGKPWGVSAIATAKWSGVRLCDVIADTCGLTYAKLLELWIRNDNGTADAEEVAKLPRHVHFVAGDGVNVSIPIEKAMNYCEFQCTRVCCVCCVFVCVCVDMNMNNMC